MCEILLESYRNSTISIGENIIRMNQGLVQGGPLSPSIFKVYMEELQEQDRALRTRATNLRRTMEAWNNGDEK